MTIRTTKASTCHAALVFTQYALCGYVGDLTAIIRDLRRLKRTANHPAASLDTTLARLTRLRADMREEVEGISDVLEPRQVELGVALIGA